MSQFYVSKDLDTFQQPAAVRDLRPAICGLRPAIRAVQALELGALRLSSKILDRGLHSTPLRVKLLQKLVCPVFWVHIITCVVINYG